jgi:hypothetical protein
MMQQPAAAPVPMRVILEPLVPSDCTMAGMPYMPLMLDRLEKSRSWLRAKRNPALGFYHMNLWARAWRGLPAGSLEDDDDVLADAAKCDPSVWPSVRADVLCGWLRCSADGRLYHPVVCELAANAWMERKKYRAGMARARAGKAKRAGAGEQGHLDLRGTRRTRTSAPPPSGGEGESDKSAAQSDQAAAWSDRSAGQSDPAVEQSDRSVEQSDPPPAWADQSPPQSDPLPVEADQTAPQSDSDSLSAWRENSNDPLESLEIPSVPPSAAGFKCEVQSEKKGENSPLPPRSKTPRCLLPVDWVPEESGCQFAVDRGLDLTELLADFTDHHRDRATRSADWSAAWRKWCREAARRAQRGGWKSRAQESREKTAGLLALDRALGLPSPAEHMAQIMRDYEAECAERARQAMAA